MPLPQTNFFRYRPTYAGQPVEEFGNYQKALANEYDVTKQEADMVKAALGSIQTTSEADKQYITGLTDTLNQSIGSLAKDVQGGTRYELAKNKIRELSLKINADEGRKTIISNAAKMAEEEKIRNELTSKGFQPLDFGLKDKSKFASVDMSSGKPVYNQYKYDIQPKGQWDDAQQKVINLVKPEMTAEELTDLGDYYKTGVRTALTSKTFEKYKDRLASAYLQSQEGTQHMNSLTKIDGLDGGKAFDKIADEILNRATLQTYDYQQNAYYGNETARQLTLAQNRMKQAKPEATGKADPYAVGVTGESTYMKNTSRYAPIKPEMFDKTGKLLDKVKNVSTVSETEKRMGIGSDVDEVKTTTKERKVLDDMKNFLVQSGKATDKITDREVNEMANRANFDYLTKHEYQPQGKRLKALYDSKRLLTVDNLPSNVNGAIKIINSNGDTKSLKEMYGKMKVKSVQPNGFVMNSDPANKERAGDMLYTITDEDGSQYKVIQSVDEINSTMGNNLKRFDAMLSPIQELDLSSETNLGKKVSKKYMIDMNNWIGGRSDVAFLKPTKGIDESGRATYKMFPMFMSNGKARPLTAPMLEKLHQADLINDTALEGYRSVLAMFNQKAGDKGYINYEDIKHDFNTTIANDPFLSNVDDTGKQQQLDKEALRNQVDSESIDADEE